MAEGLGGMALRSVDDGACVDGLAQEDDAVWRRGGVDDRETWHVRRNSTTLKMDWWQVAAAASYCWGT